MLLYVVVGMKAATTAIMAREKGKSSVAAVLFFFSFSFYFILLWLQRRCVPFLFKTLAARREGIAAVRSDGEVEGSGGRQLRAEGSDRRSRLCAGGQWHGGRGSGGSINGYNRGGGLMVADGGGGSNDRGSRHIAGRWVGLCVTAMRAIARATSDGGGLRGCTKEEQRVMAAGAASSCSVRGEKEAEKVVATAEVTGKKRRLWLAMGGSGGWRPELAVAVVKKVGRWLWLRVDYDSGKLRKAAIALGVDCGWTAIEQGGEKGILLFLLSFPFFFFLMNTRRR
ncbi:hypothetical protein B296_00018654 [Ensete ventricosum]|uniref:Uncharacterized protein n=1 Tax=Ensete ventricosum TaxID=4639 RepID=A0A426YL23_ENSVE|nr:hypothetical protein B296_00018654 [Ensete ventricosum]